MMDAQSCVQLQLGLILWCFNVYTGTFCRLRQLEYSACSASSVQYMYWATLMLQQFNWR